MGRAGYRKTHGWARQSVRERNERARQRRRNACLHVYSAERDGPVPHALVAEEAAEGRRKIMQRGPSYVYRDPVTERWRVLFRGRVVRGAFGSYVEGMLRLRRLQAGLVRAEYEE